MLARLLFVIAAPLILTGCLITPGKFSSTMEVMKGGDFSFTYKGEIQLLAFSQLAEMGKNANAEFEPEPCYLDDGVEERACTRNEIEGQRANWEANAESRQARQEQEAEQFKALLGGIDPSNPEAAEEFAESLSRQKGWNTVVHMGDGLFEFEYAIRGNLSHDFAFPMIEGMPVGSSFVTAILRDDGKVRINAPGFSSQGGGGPMSEMFGLMQLGQAAKQDNAAKQPRMATPDGPFTIRTDGEILANNTDEGAAGDGAVQTLSWSISQRTSAAPTALINITPGNR